MSVSGGLPQDPKRLVAIRERTEAALKPVHQKCGRCPFDWFAPPRSKLESVAREDVPWLLAEVERLREALRDVPDAYERKVTRALDFTLPDHTADCDENATSGLCLRCSVMAHTQVAFGMSRPLNAAVSVPVGEGER
jgi:hypothetical protein